MLSAQLEALCWLAGEFGDEFVVLVEVQDGEVSELGGGSDQQVGEGGRPMVSSFCERELKFDGAGFDLRGQILDGHR